jgi:hypothetical protein
MMEERCLLGVSGGLLKASRTVIGHAFCVATAIVEIFAGHIGIDSRIRLAIRYDQRLTHRITPSARLLKKQF